MQKTSWTSALLVPVTLAVLTGAAIGEEPARSDREARPPAAASSAETDGAIPLFPPRAERSWFDVPPPSVRPAREPYHETNLFRRVLDDQAYLVKTWWPAEARDLEFSLPLAVALVGARSSATLGADLTLQRSLEEWTAGGRRDAAQAISKLGDVETAVVLIGGGYLVARWAGSERMTRATSLSAEALIDVAIASTVLKKIARRTRPADGGTGEFFTVAPDAGQSTTSFPSGHAMGAFAVAAVFSAEFRDVRWVPFVAYGVAGLVALSRVGLGRHFPSDVIAGAVLGRSIGGMVAERAGLGRREPRRARFAPVVDPETGGLGVTYTRRW